MVQGCSCSCVLRSSRCHNAGTGPTITDLVAGPPLKKTCSSSQSSLWVSLMDLQDGPKLPVSLSPHPDRGTEVGRRKCPRPGGCTGFQVQVSLEVTPPGPAPVTASPCPPCGAHPAAPTSTRPGCCARPPSPAGQPWRGAGALSAAQSPALTAS